MSLISNILDAIRRVGSPTEKSALLRQDRQLAGEEVLARGRIVARDGDEDASGFHATIAPSPEQLVRLDAARLEAIDAHAKRAPKLFEAFGIDPAAHRLDQLERAFEVWLDGPDRRGYAEADIVAILGASFGNFCNESLDMHWIEVSDRHGTSLAVDGNEVEFRAYPYDSIHKRIASAEHTFFRGIHVFLRHQKQNSRARESPT